MAEAAEEVKALSRVVYVEPTLPENTGGVQEGTVDDSIAHPYENFSMAVDLTIERVNRYSCGLGTETGEVEKTEASTTNGTIKFTGRGDTASFLGGTNGVLTTNYTDVSLADPSKNTGECFGIESINICYNSWVYPEVTIRFVDVRGATVMLPAEQNYYNEGGKIENDKGGRQINNIYRAFFTFPYPLFTLTVKGFYGMGVTYKLACEKTTMELDAASGNFIITAKFIGHMFKLYSEIPMTFLAISPFLPEGKTYWNERINDEVFKFKDAAGNPTSDFMTIPDLKLKLAQVANSEEYLSAAAEQVQAQENFDQEIGTLEEMKESPFSRHRNDVKTVEVNKYSTRFVSDEYVIHKGAAGAENNDIPEITIIDLKNTSPEEFLGEVKDYYMALSQFNENVATETGVKDAATAMLGTQSLFGGEESNAVWAIEKDATGKRRLKSKPTTKRGYFFDAYSSATRDIHNTLDWTEGFQELEQNILSKVDKDSTNIIILEGKMPEQTTDFNKIIREKKAAKKKKLKELEEKMDELIEKLLGFRPSIQNMFNLVFAHMDTFIHCFYEHMSVIKDQLDGDRTKRAKETFAVNDEYTDTEARQTGSPDFYGNYLPPFTAFYEDSTDDSKKKVLLWPGDNGIENGEDLEEVRFVKEILAATEEYADKMAEVEEAIAALAAAAGNGSGNTGGFSTSIDNFIPITPYDFVYKDKVGNPYKEIKACCKSNNLNELKAKVFFKFAMRCFAYLLSLRQIEFYHSSYWTTDYMSEMAKLFGQIEAMNFARAVGTMKSSNALNQFLKDYADDKNTTEEKRVFTRIITGEFNQKDASANEEAMKLYEAIKKYWPLGAANTDKARLFTEVKGNMMYSLNKGKYCFLPLNVSNLEEIKGAFALGDSSLKMNSDFLPTLNITRSDKERIPYTKKYEKNVPQPGGSFVVLEAGNYAFQIANKVKALKLDEEHPLDFEVDGELYRKNIILLPQEDQVTGLYGKTYKDGTIERITDEGVDTSQKHDQYEEMLLDKAKSSYFVKHPCLIDEEIGDSLFDYTVGTNKLNFYEAQQNAPDPMKAKAYLFLFTIPLHGYNYGLVRGTSPSGSDTETEGPRNQVTFKLRLLREGALWWRLGQWKKDNFDTMKDPVYCPSGVSDPKSTQGFVQDKGEHDNLETIWVKTGRDNSSYAEWHDPKASSSRIQTLRAMFETWAEDTSDLGFAGNEKRLRDTSLYINGEYSDGLDVSKLSDSEDARKLQTFLKDVMLTLCTTIDFYGGMPVKSDKPSSFIKLSDGKHIALVTKKIREAFDVFMDSLNNSYGEWVKKMENNPEDAARKKAEEILADPFKSKDLKLSIYMTLKSLYDKWLCSAYRGTEAWKLESGESDFDRFIYIDSFYNKIGLQLTANISKVSEWLNAVLPSSEAYAQDTSLGLYQGVTLYEFLAGVAQNCGGYLYALPQKVGQTDSQEMMNMFKPLSISDNWVTDDSTFVFLYTYQPSQHLEAESEGCDMNGWSTEGDGFDLTDEEIIGKVMPDTGDNSYKVPGFGVTYAKQNQSFFKNITLTSEDAANSEIALRATFDIAAKAHQEGAREATLFGQDIYRIYSQYAYTCGVEMMGNMQITPMMYFQLNNVPMWHGAYMIMKVTHDITAGNITTKFVGQRQNRFAVPTSDMGVIVAKKVKPSSPGGTDAAAGGGGGGYGGTVTTVNGVPVVGPQAGDPSVSTIPIDNEDKISETNPVFVLTPAHGNTAYRDSKGNLVDKTKENAWSLKICEAVVSKLKNKGLVAVRGNKAQPSGYKMADARNIARKYGSEKVVSIVPHWNGGGGKYFYAFFGLDNGVLFNIHQNSPFLSQCMVKAAKEVQSRGTDASKLHSPKGGLSGPIKIDGDLYKTAGRELVPKNADPGLNFNYNLSNGVTPAAVLLEDWFGDYATESGVWYEFNGKKDSEGRFVAMYDWFMDTEGINTVSDMIVNGCLMYIDWLKGGKQDMEGLTVTRTGGCGGGGEGESYAAGPSAVQTTNTAAGSSSVRGGGESFSHLVKNERMKKVLQNVSVLCRQHDYKGNTMWRKLRNLKTNPEGCTYPVSEKGKCTCGPSTWYWFGGNDLYFYPAPETSNHNNVKLRSYGMKMVWHGTINQARALTTDMFRPGDVSVQHYYLSGQASGHGCMWTGKDWRSDFVQATIMASSSQTDKHNRDGNYSVSIWRHPDFQDPGNSGSDDALRGKLPKVPGTDLYNGA